MMGEIRRTPEGDVYVAGGQIVWVDDDEDSAEEEGQPQAEVRQNVSAGRNVVVARGSMTINRS